ISLFLLHVNRKEDRIETQLGMRYQVKENLRTLRFFALIGVPCVIWQSLATLLLLLSLPIFYSQPSTITCSQLYTLTVTAILLMSSVVGGKPSRLQSTRERRVEPAVDDGEMYRTMLQRQW
ncbi:hypothetical protein PENTCL1PPCAC_22164, partial [Pristionchus entomophagus]